MSVNQLSPEAYSLGHTAPELERLEHQGAYLRGRTRALLQKAGLKPGMRVLDFGAGVGDVSLLAAELVGPEGFVLGFDRSGEAIELARARAVYRAVKNVQFIQGDEAALSAIPGLEPFDALIGRFVLIHQVSLKPVLMPLFRLLKPGAIVAFQEPEVSAQSWTNQPNPLLEQLWRWVEGVVARGLFNATLPAEILAFFESQGMQAYEITREGWITRSVDPATAAWLIGFGRTLSGPARALGLVRPEDQTFEALFEQVQHQDPGAVSIPLYFMHAYGRLPPLCA